MCIAYLALATDPQWPLFIAANRDEAHARPTRPAAPWPNQPDIYGGLDLEAGGTWFAIHKNGRFALLTNHRNLRLASPEKPRSRGFLCKDFVESQMTPSTYLEQIQSQAKQYAGFNLIVGQWHTDLARFECYYYSNQLSQPPQALAPGYYVLSNDFLNTPWPKSQRLADRLTHHLQSGGFKESEEVFTILKDNTPAPDHLLPDTGLDLARERLVSSPFIISPEYGTRSSSIWAVDKNGRSILHECSYNPEGIETQRHSWPLSLFTTL